MEKRKLIGGVLVWFALLSFIVPTNVFANKKAAAIDEDQVEIEENMDDYYNSDPLEPMNRLFFQVNDVLYGNVIRPVADGYAAVVAEDFRICFSNFWSNLASPIRFVNALLQGRFKDSMTVLGRFLLNTTVGAGGLGDPAATEFDLARQKADFGQTLGVWGIGEGLYIYWPLLGPSNVRDTVGYGGDYFLHPLTWADWNWETRLGINAGFFINDVSVKPDSYTSLTESALDPYVAVRSAYVDYRRNLVEQYKFAGNAQTGE